MTDSKPTQPQAFMAGLSELLEHYPLVRLFTGDARFAQRPLAQAILNTEGDF